MFKTLVVDLDGKLAVAIVPVAAQVDLRSFGKRVAMADGAKAESATGYVLGGISPLGQRRPLPTTIDESALGHETIHVSAGRRGLELELDPNDLVRLTGATVARSRALTGGRRDAGQAAAEAGSQASSFRRFAASSAATL